MIIIEENEEPIKYNPTDSRRTDWMKDELKPRRVLVEVGPGVFYDESTDSYYTIEEEEKPPTP